MARQKTAAAASPDAYLAALRGWRRGTVAALRTAVRSAAPTAKLGDPTRR